MDWLAIVSAIMIAGGCAPLAFFFPNCVCCAPLPCAQACNAAAPLSATVTIAGYTNGTCSTCADYNATYICALVLDNATLCRWQNTTAKSCNVALSTDAVTVELRNPAGTANLTVQNLIAAKVSPDTSGTSVNWADSLGSAPVNCSGTFMLPHSTTDYETRCLHDESDVTVTL